MPKIQPIKGKRCAKGTLDSLHRMYYLYLGLSKGLNTEEQS